MPLTYSPAPLIPASRLLCLICHIFFSRVIKINNQVFIHEHGSFASQFSCYGAFIHSCLSFWGFAYYKDYSSKETAAEERYPPLYCPLFFFLSTRNVNKIQFLFICMYFFHVSLAISVIGFWPCFWWADVCYIASTTKTRLLMWLMFVSTKCKCSFLSED